MSRFYKNMTVTDVVVIDDLNYSNTKTWSSNRIVTEIKKYISDSTHTHSNKAILDLLNQDSGVLTYNGEKYKKYFEMISLTECLSVSESNGIISLGLNWNEFENND